MPVHDWSRVEAGIFHAFHHRWISAISDRLNGGVLPRDYYALPEQFAGGFGPDVLTLERPVHDRADTEAEPARDSGGTALIACPPKLAPTAETDMEFYYRKQNSIVVRHVTGDRVVAMVEIVSPGNKSSTTAIGKFVKKAADLLDRGIHLLIIDLLPPGARDPQGMYALVWDEVSGQRYAPPQNKPFTCAAYECDLALRTYVRAVGLGDVLGDMPLFLEANACVDAPLEATYETAFNVMPERWRRVLDATPRY